MNVRPLIWCHILFVLSLGAVTAHAQLPEHQATERKPVFVAQTIAPSPMPEPEAVTPIDTIHIVKPGETLYRVAHRYGVTVDRVRQWNRMPDDTIEVGQRLIVGKSEPDHSNKPLDLTMTPTSAFNLAYNDYLNERYDSAVAGFQRFTIEFSGTSLIPDACYWLGESYYQQREYVQAMHTWERFLTEYPGNEKEPAALYKTGIAAGEVGDFVKLKKFLKQVIAEFPSSDEAKLARLAQAR